MAKKFIPNGDHDFLKMAENFAANVGGSPEQYGISEADAAELRAATARFAEAMRACGNPYERSPAVTAVKEQTRRSAETILRRLTAVIKSNPAVDGAAKVIIGLNERTKAAAPLTVPDEVPRFSFWRAYHENGQVPEHELGFGALDGSARPRGAVRLELFVDLIPADVSVQAHYRDGLPSRPVYVRSYTKSPIRLVPPMADVPMRVIYFARWADADGNVGPMTGAVEGWVEGGRHHLMNGPLMGHKPVMRIDVSPETVTRETTVLVAMITGQTAKRATMIEQQAVRRIEGTVEAEAA